MITIDQAGRLVLTSTGVPCCPPARTGVATTGPGDDLSTIGADAAPPDADPTAQWDGEVFRNKVPGPHFDPVWRVRCCAAPATLSAAHRNWLGSP
jgi:hypothetical protein